MSGPKERISTEEYQELAELKKGNKYGARRCEAGGHRFDSKVERDRYLWLIEDPSVVHVDVHPVFCLFGGIRYRADFLVYLDGELPPVVEDVKGRKPSTDFRRVWKIFNLSHPLAPLIVVRRAGRGWEAYTDPDNLGGWK